MNWKIWLCIGMAVLVAHLMIILIISNVHELTNPPPKPVEPGFSTNRYTYVDAQGKPVKVVTEFTVSTRFAKPEELAKLPPQVPEAKAAPVANPR